MQLRTAIIYLLGCALYPLWLIAAIADYTCHRRTRIETTSGATESDFHLAQFATVAVIVLGGTLFEPTALVLGCLVTAALLHTVLAYYDVRYTQPRRFIPPLEQQAHGFMDVLPIVAVLLIGALASGDVPRSGAGMASLPLRSSIDWPSWLIVGTFTIGGGLLTCEERWRTARAGRHSDTGPYGTREAV